MEVSCEEEGIIEGNKSSSLGNWVGDDAVNANREFKRRNEFG